MAEFHRTFNAFPTEAALSFTIWKCLRQGLLFIFAMEKLWFNPVFTENKSPF